MCMCNVRVCAGAAHGSIVMENEVGMLMYYCIVMWGFALNHNRLAHLLDFVQRLHGGIVCRYELYVLYEV